MPLGRCRDSELEGCLQVGLLEHSEHPAGVRNFELAVEVYLVVDWVNEAVQTLSGIGVFEVAGNHELVLGGQPSELNPHAIVDSLDIQCLAVQGDGVECSGDGIDKGGCPGRRGEAHGCGAGKSLWPGREVKVNVVTLHREDRLALLGF